MTEDEMVRWHHRVNGHEFEQTLGNGEGQGTLVCYSPWGRKELDMTEQLNNNISGKFLQILNHLNFLFQLQKIKGSEILLHHNHYDGYK